MKILDAAQIRECDRYTIANEPIASIDLMERAANTITDWLFGRYCFYNRPFTFFAGSGNNGGDALAVARQLKSMMGTPIMVYKLEIGTTSADCQQNLVRLQQTEGVTIKTISKGDPRPSIDPESVVVEGIFGSGLNRPVEGYWAELIEHINNSGNEIVAIDIPSGLFCTDNRQNTGAIIKATHTLSLQLAKLSFLFAENEPFVGQFHILPIGISQQAIDSAETAFNLTQKADLARLVKPRSKFAHKGTFGHALLSAGSYQMSGAAVLAARACLHTGCGLLTVHVPQSAYQIMQTAVPEAILNIDDSQTEYCTADRLQRFTAVGIGPGIGQSQQVRDGLAQLLKNCTAPMVIDADAINILADTPKLLNSLKPNTILTPHPGEFDRLTHKHTTGYERMLTQIELAQRLNVIIVLKGAFTSVVTPDGTVRFNTTGNAGMATAGSGDVLTGIILSLLAQKYTPAEAAVLGVGIHGLAGDIAARTDGMEFVTASNITDNLGKAFLKLKNLDNE
ncbi:MAG: NAD(P)H-hydrate dehydratase [Salinivirgaceae bacterium]|nr:NAD(P)H-hydrate dehydratase [Salinivirgaceae bacterium]